MQVSRLLIAGAVAALLQSAAVVAQTPPPNGMPSHPAEGGQGGVSFDSLDKDHDGRISKTEAAANANVKKDFTRYDKNGNGYIEKDEVMSPDVAPADTPKQ